MPTERVVRLSHDALIGNHLPNNGEGLTAQDLFELLQSIPAPARRESYVMVDGEDVTGIGIAQSSEAEKWEFKFYIKHTGESKL
jgi:hypothetical protein